MVSDIAFEEVSDKMECDLGNSDKQVADYIEWFKSDPSKRVWQGGV